MQTSDRDLVKALKGKKTRNAAFTILVREYQRPLYGHIRRMVGSHQNADDVLQNTFMKAWRFIDDFKEESSLFTWLYRIATNEALSFLRKQKKHEIETGEITEIHTNTTDGYSGEEITRKLEAALKTLPAKQRQVFDLKYFSELKYEEIAEITETSVGALKASFYHAVKKIEAFLTSH